ncbi:hypothetical protein RB594_003938 [Gaeumannomyces avenae]
MSLHDDGSDGSDDAALMAETMGFAGFGAQTRPSKKRRMNDAFVELPQGSAANGTPLGARRPAQPQSQPQSAELPLHQAAAAVVAVAAAAAAPSTTNDDEIDLDDDDDDDDEGGGGAPAAVATPPAGLPPRPPAGGGGDGPTSGPHSQQQQHHQHHGRGGGGSGRHGDPSASGRQWWLDYYDQRFNENPWARLEKSLGLEPRGSWPPPRGHVY